MYTHAIVRKPASNFSEGLTTSQLGKPSFELLQIQHSAYIRTLEKLGLSITVLPALPDYPDAYFVEDTAVVAQEVAVITNPGAPSRQGEEKSIQEALSEHKKIENILTPGTVDGGDVLMVGRHIFIGISERTNEEGAQQLSDLYQSFGYSCHIIPVGDGLHLKSSVNYVGRNTLLLTQPFQHLSLFDDFDKIVLEDTESYVANTLWVNDTLIMPAGFANTKDKLSRLNLPIIELDVSEVMKMDGGLTCLSLRF